MTNADLDILEHLEKCATPGPWVVMPSDGDMVMRGGGETLMCDMQYYPWPPSRQEDWLFIAAIRNAAPKLIAELRRLRNPETPPDGR